MTIISPLPDSELTARWTSRAYQIRFGKIETVQALDTPDAPFTLSAWGISQGLMLLLSDFTASEIHSSAEWLTMQQNNIVAQMLEQMSFQAHFGGEALPPLEHLFITIDAELYLPKGFRMEVACVTNIVPNDEENESLQKFVAILDMSEVQDYIMERRDTNGDIQSEKLH